MKAVKVLQVIGGGEIGGAERHLLALMRLLDRERYRPELLCLCRGPFAAMCRAEGIVTHEIIMRHKLDLATTGPIAALIRDNGFDLVHTHGMRANLVARRAAVREGVPVVTTFHSMMRYDYPSSLEAWSARMLTRMTNRLTDRFIAVSDAVKKDIAGLGIRDDLIEVVYNGLEMEKLSPQRDAAAVRADLGIDRNATVAAVIGRLHPVKGQRHFIEAAAELAPRFPGMVFILVGDGPDRETLRELVMARGLGDRLIMTGFYPRVYEIYPAIDILCLPSLMEGMGLVLLEALSFGVPVAASRVGGIPEIIRDGETGLLVPPGDSAALAEAVIRLASNSELRRTLSANGRERARQFTMERMARETGQVYEKVLNRSI